MNKYEIDVAVFSYNRCNYLKNCVDSVNLNIPNARLRVFDDNSSDPEMVEYLDGLGDIVVRAPESGQGRHGGLYGNMQHAYATATGKYLLMLQDDVQVVRVVTAEDWSDIERIYANDPKCAFVSVLFMRGSRMRRYRRQLISVPHVGTYDGPVGLSEKNLGRRLAYYDVSLWNLDRLRAAHWHVSPSEGGNVVRAREIFSAMPVMKAPFVFFCPEVPFYRNRSQTLAARIASRFLGSHLKCYQQMTSQQVQDLRTRDMSRWPKAEDFLTPNDPIVRRPFVFKDVKARWWLYALHKLEQKFSRRR